MEKRCKILIEYLCDADKADKLFQAAKTVIDEVSGTNLDRDHVRTQAVTQAILLKLRK
jgi:hypothetical protein